LEIISLLALGVVAGILAGLLGVGGGIVIVPVLVWIFSHGNDVPALHLMHIAIGTSLTTIVFTSLSSIRAHHQHGAIQWDLFKRLTPSIIVGAFMGALVADMIPSHGLHLFFSCFLLLAAIQMGIGKQPVPSQQLPKGFKLGIAGFLIGKISSLVGIGGGSLVVPYLSWSNIPMRQAVATSAATGFPIAISSMLGFIIMGWDAEQLPAWSTGYVYWAAVIAIVPTSLLCAPLGAKLAHTVPVKLLKRFFAVFLIFVGLKMLSMALTS